jgi:predicted anti-sigma-YlaC factor YlaD
MDECSKIREILIDGLYEDSYDAAIEKHIEECEGCRKYAEEIRAGLSGMDVLDFEVETSMKDISMVLSRAESIRDRKRKSIESAAFLLVCILMLSVISLAVITFGAAAAVAAQVVIFLTLPLLVVPLLRIKALKGESSL